MKLACDVSLGAMYSSSSQKARVITETWVAQNGYCLACSSDRLAPTPRNTKARDFECPECNHPYELKSLKGMFGRQIADGAYSAMMSRIASSSAPSFLLLGYDASWNVRSFQAIHHLFITPFAIKARAPLSKSAVRSGWVGCNVLLDHVPLEGRIDIVRDGTMIPKSESRQLFTQSENLSGLSVKERSWTAVVLNLIHGLGKATFSLEEIYSLESHLAEIYPANVNIRPKIRQQLQVLRDLGFLRFVSRGMYQLTK